MVKNSSAILAVNPGSRYIGIAVFREDDLLDWRVSSIKRQSLPQRKQNLEKLLSVFVERYGVAAMVLKRVHLSRSSPGLKLLIAGVREYAMGNRLEVSELSLETIKDRLLKRAKCNKRDIMEHVSCRYTFLKPLYQKQADSKHPYLVRMFEAVALGMAFLNDINS